MQLYVVFVAQDRKLLYRILSGHTNNVSDLLPDFWCVPHNPGRGNNQNGAIKNNGDGFKLIIHWLELNELLKCIFIKFKGISKEKFVFLNLF